MRSFITCLMLFTVVACSSPVFAQKVYTEELNKGEHKPEVVNVYDSYTDELLYSYEKFVTVRVGLALAGGDNNREDLSEHFDRAAHSVLDWLGNLGYKSHYLLSNYSDHVETRASLTNFQDTMGAIAKYLSQQDPRINHELFIYIVGHGGEAVQPDGTTIGNGQVVLHTPGSRFPATLSRAELVNQLKRLPTNVVVTIFIDACYSGSFLGLNRKGQVLIPTDPYDDWVGLVVNGNLAGLKVVASSPYDAAQTSGLVDNDFWGCLCQGMSGILDYNDLVNTYWFEDLKWTNMSEAAKRMQRAKAGGPLGFVDLGTGMFGLDPLNW